MSTSLTALFNNNGSKEGDDAALEPALAAAVERGRAAWPLVRLDLARFVQHLARHRVADQPAEVWLGDVHAPDLYLACACALDAPGAVAAFGEAAYMPLVQRYLLRARANRGILDELCQRVREKLLVGATPKIGDYGGRGPLKKWIEVVALRITIDLSRGSGATCSSTSPIDSLGGAGTVRTPSSTTSKKNTALSSSRRCSNRSARSTPRSETSCGSTSSTP